MRWGGVGRVDMDSVYWLCGYWLSVLMAIAIASANIALIRSEVDVDIASETS